MNIPENPNSNNLFLHSNKHKSRIDDDTLFIAKKLKFYRRSKNLTQSEVGQALNITIQQVQKYEKGVNRISAGRLKALAHFATSVTPEFDYTLRKIALERNMLLSEVLEEALKLYQSETYLKNP